MLGLLPFRIGYREGNMKIRMIALILVFTSVAHAQEQGRGLLLHDEAAFDGYTLFAPLGKLETHLIDMAGNVVHS